MKPMQLLLLLATASVSLAAGCPFAKFAKAGGNGPPELDHEKLGELYAQMKKYTPHEGASFDTEDSTFRHPEIKNEL